MEPLTHHFNSASSPMKIFIAVLVVAVLAGVGTGYYLVTSSPASADAILPGEQKPTTAQQDTRTFSDSAEGTIEKKPVAKTGAAYSEGTHILKRDNPTPVTLTSSVVDLSEYEGKKVKVYGQTYDSGTGWLMDVGKVEVE